MSRMGPRMRDVVWWVSRMPGCYMVVVASKVGPNGSLKYGYRTVHRAIRAGLVRKVPGKRDGTWALYPVDNAGTSGG